MWTNFFESGGWGMYPTSLFGFFLVAAGVLLVLRPQRRFLPPVAALTLATLGSGVLSTCVGIINTIHYVRKVPSGEQLDMIAAGVGESLHNTVLALLLVVPTMLLATVAAVRAARTATSEPRAA